jgi:hypothetical protein
MTSSAIVIRQQPDDDRSQPDASVAEILGEDLRVVAQVPIYSGRTVVPLPYPGRYLVRGWTPTGRPFEEFFHTDDQTDVVVTPAPQTNRSPGPGHAVRWVIPWMRDKRRWVPMTAMQALSADLLAELPRQHSGTPVAVQLGGDDGPIATVLTVQGEDLLIGSWAAEGGEVALFGDDVAAALLGYLSHGDLRAAALLADRHARDSDRVTTSAAVALAYVRFLTEAEPDADSAEELVRRLPGSADAYVLAAWHELRSPQPDIRAVRRSLTRAHELGGPVIASGVRLLADGLALVSHDREGLPHRPTAVILGNVRQYQRAMGHAALTTYSSLTPNVPLRLDPASTPAEPANWTRLSMRHELTEGWESRLFDEPAPVQSSLASPTIRAVQKAERSAVDGFGDRARSADLKARVRRQIFRHLRGLGYGRDAYELAAGPISHADSVQVDRPRQIERLWRSTAGIVVIQLSPHLLRVQGSSEGVVRVRYVVDRRTYDVLVPLIEPVGWEVELPVPFHVSVSRDVIRAILVPVESLTDNDVPLIRRSVAEADRTTRSAWRAVSRRYPPRHPVFEAIIDGLV